MRDYRKKRIATADIEQGATYCNITDGIHRTVTARGLHWVEYRSRRGNGAPSEVRRTNAEVFARWAKGTVASPPGEE